MEEDVGDCCAGYGGEGPRRNCERKRRLGGGAPARRASAMTADFARNCPLLVPAVKHRRAGAPSPPSLRQRFSILAMEEVASASILEDIFLLFPLLAWVVDLCAAEPKAASNDVVTASSATRGSIYESFLG